MIRRILRPNRLVRTRTCRNDVWSRPATPRQCYNYATAVASTTQLSRRRGIGPSMSPARSPKQSCRYLSSAAAEDEEAEEAEDDDDIDIQSTEAPKTQSPSYERFIDGPPLQLGLASFGAHAAASIVGLSGSTVLTTTVCKDSNDNNSNLTVDVRFRTHGVGSIPQNRMRKDYGVMSDAEILASRAVDRALRPMLRNDYNEESGHLHVQSVVQSYDNGSRSSQQEAMSGDIVATSINTASAALYQYMTEPVAATTICIMPESSLGKDKREMTTNGKQPQGLVIVQDPSPTQLRDSLGHLLLAGTRDKIVMMEWTSHGCGNAGLPEEQWEALLHIGMAALQPLLDTVEEAQAVKGKQEKDKPREDIAETEVRASLGLDPLISVTANDDMTEGVLASDASSAERDRILDQASKHCATIFQYSLGRLFGGADETFHKQSLFVFDRNVSPGAMVHRNGNLLSKSFRAARETVMQNEIRQQTDSFLRSLPIESQFNGKDRQWLQDKVVEKLFKETLWEAIKESGCRSDRRGGPGTGWRTIRPIRVQSPALPDTSVHGSALFARGETQVLCTVTLGPPSDGIAQANPYEVPAEAFVTDTNTSLFSALPVGSLRFLRNQESLTSDLNSTKVQADREPTGASGNLSELKRAFLQYDFPAYSTGKVPDGSQINKRRSVGHGNLAERAILPLIPSPDEFPYTIRMTSEVTDSNGSSSMASVCGVTMALLDAGVPLFMPVAGVSVGAVCLENDYALMLDITGTEDFYGAMDLKVAGTADGVTALQMDVKQPLAVETIVRAMFMARRGRRSIIREMQAQRMNSGGLKHRAELKRSAPRVEIVRFDPQRKRDAIGPGGMVLRQLEDRYGVSLDLTQEGQCLIFGPDRDMVQKAKTVIMDLVSDVAVGDVLTGTVIEIKDFGAVVELLRNKEGLLHVSEITNDNDPGNHSQGLTGFVRQQLHVGQEIEVRVIGMDPVQGSIKLSMRQLKQLANPK